MSRLTKRAENGAAIYATPSGNPVKWENNRNKVLRKLAEYEDLEEQGLLKKFDCAIGDTVYRINSLNEIYECTVIGIRQEFSTMSYFLHADINRGDYSIRVDSWFDECQIGYEFYLTKEEAEKELKRLESD